GGGGVAGRAISHCAAGRLPVPEERRFGLLVQRVQGTFRGHRGSHTPHATGCGPAPQIVSSDVCTLIPHASKLVDRLMNIELLKRLCETPGIPGREERVRELIRKEVADLF